MRLWSYPIRLWVNSHCHPSPLSWRCGGPLSEAATDDTNVALARDEFVWLLGSLCQLNRIPFDQNLLIQRFPAPHGFRQFIEALRSLGFKTGENRLARKSIEAASFPCVGFLKG